MELINLSHIFKYYETKNQKKEALNDISLSFPNASIVFFLGSSGCGKTTLLNIIGGIDKPSKGTVTHFPYKSISKNDRSIKSYIFQNYHLLENETSLFNVMVALLINGEPFSSAKDKSIKLLKSYGFTKDLINKKVSLLSGGEKQRVAICRALIVDPEVILADEPTGALDKENSIKTMEFLKDASKDRLVIVVTHNESLANKYADRIIRMSDGRIVDDIIINNYELDLSPKKNKKNKHDCWSLLVTLHNMKRRIKRNFVSLISVVFCLTFALLMTGFSSNYQNSINEVSKRHLDYGFSTISKEETNNISNSSISLVKTSRPNIIEMKNLISEYPELKFDVSYDYFLSNSSFFQKGKEIENLTYSFVYDYNEKYVDKNLIIEGKFPKQSSNEVLVNKAGYEALISDKSNLKYKVNYEHFFEKSNGEECSDILNESLDFNVVGVVDELEFLSVPKVYLSYKYINHLFSNLFLDNYSDFKQEDYSWRRLILNANNNDKNSGYCFYLFLIDISKTESIVRAQKNLTSNLKITNNAIEIKNAMDSFTFAANVGIKMFLFIVIFGTILIISIFSYAAYSDDKKEYAILSCLGAQKLQISFIMIREVLIICAISLIFSFAFSMFLESPINHIIEGFTGINGMIKIPFEFYKGIRYFLPIIFSLFTFVIAIFSSVIPQIFSKKISLSKELSEL